MPIMSARVEGKDVLEDVTFSSHHYYGMRLRCAEVSNFTSLLMAAAVATSASLPPLSVCLQLPKCNHKKVRLLKHDWAGAGKWQRMIFGEVTDNDHSNTEMIIQTLNTNHSTARQGMPRSAEGISTPKAEGSPRHEVATRGGRRDILPYARL